jgi:hypothetical protein
MMEVKIPPFIHDMKNLRQNISPSGNSFVDVPPAREDESHKIPTIFYRTASRDRRQLHVLGNDGSRTALASV